jgi:hypothetical protein
MTQRLVPFFVDVRSLLRRLVAANVVILLGVTLILSFTRAGWFAMLE